MKGELDASHRLGAMWIIMPRADQTSVSANWRETSFDEAFSDHTSHASKIPQGEFLHHGKYPIVDQGNSFIAGYTNDESRVWRDALPVIIFGDHTRALKFVDFPFVLGADGCKVLVPSKDLHPKFAYYLLSGLRLEGAGYSRHFKFLRDQPLRFPEQRDEQRRIVGLLDQADRLRRTRRYALELNDTFLPAVFLELFGNTLHQQSRWQQTPLGELVRKGDKINYGVVQPGDDLVEGVPIVRVADLDNLETSTPNLKRISPEIDEQHSASRLVGDELLIGCVGSIGKVAKAIPKLRGFNIARAVARVPCDWSQINRAFLEQYLRSPRVQDYFGNETRTVSQPTLNILQIQETLVIMPPLPLQQKFAMLVERQERLRAGQREALRQAEHLFQALLHQAFTVGI